MVSLLATTAGPKWSRLPSTLTEKEDQCFGEAGPGWTGPCQRLCLYSKVPGSAVQVKSAAVTAELAASRQTQRMTDWFMILGFQLLVGRSIIGALA